MHARGEHHDSRRPARLIASVVLGCLACNGGTAPEESGRRDRSQGSVQTPPECTAVAAKPRDRIRFGLVGFWGDTGQGDAFQPMRGFLEARVGVPVDLVCASRYDELVDWVAEGRIEVALVPPLAYVKANVRIPCLHLLRTMVIAGSVHYSGYLLVRSDSPITRARDLAGRRIAFVEPASASGYLFARRYLEQEGFDVARDLRGTPFLGSHDAVLRAVLSGEVDAGASFEGALRRARGIGIDTASLRILAITGRIPLDALVAVPDLDPGLIERIQAALDDLNTTNPEGRSALAGLDIVGWARSDDSLYDEIRKVLPAAANHPGEAP